MKKKNNEPKPKWTVTTRVKDGGPHEKTQINHLKFEGGTVHTLNGAMGGEILQKAADGYNASNYTPILNSTKLLHELSASKRKELDDLYAKSVPDLFVGSEVEA